MAKIKSITTIASATKDKTSIHLPYHRLFLANPQVRHSWSIATPITDHHNDVQPLGHHRSCSWPLDGRIIIGERRRQSSEHQASAIGRMAPWWIQQQRRQYDGGQRRRSIGKDQSVVRQSIVGAINCPEPAVVQWVLFFILKIPYVPFFAATKFFIRIHLFNSFCCHNNFNFLENRSFAFFISKKTYINWFLIEFINPDAVKITFLKNSKYRLNS